MISMASVFSCALVFSCAFAEISLDEDVSTDEDVISNEDFNASVDDVNPIALSISSIASSLLRDRALGERSISMSLLLASSPTLTVTDSVGSREWG